MAEIVVHRCKLHIRRTSGWAWGASEDELIRAATHAIPQLLGARLPDLDVPGATEISVDRPVRVHVATSVRQLAALGAGATGTQDIVELRARITADVAAAVAAAIARDGTTTAPRQATERTERDVDGAEPGAAVAAELARGDAPRRAVRAWFRANRIDAVLDRLEPIALARLHEWLLAEAPAAAALAP
ncbi:MAG TPA: hypothetical protein VLT45_15115, partial [Kofleriaceae bacterium]|nr:hypothetical protein [Kofleriaceae bacterium]